MIRIRLDVSKFLLSALLFLFFSCDEFCEEPNRTAIVVNFYSLETDIELPVRVKITCIVSENELYPDPLFTKLDFAQVLLPVNPGADSISFSIENGEMPADTVTFHYIRHVGFISSECGCVTYAEIHKEPERTEHSILRLEILNPNASTVSYREDVINEENIRIYY